MSAAALRWDGSLQVLDQTLLPFDERWLTLRGADDAAAAIRRLAVRGAPLIGIVAGYALALEAAARPATLGDAAARLRSARPTAVNLAWAVDRVLAASEGGAGAALAEAEAIHAYEDAASAAIARRGAEHLAATVVPAAGRPVTLLTHCNTGALAAGGEGTALAVVLEMARRHHVEVLACETRPLLQGARLTAWELARAGVPHALLADAAAAGLMRRGEIDAVVVGADRVAANGDVVNKVGTYAHALAAHAAGVPFVVAAPASTVDRQLPDGDAVVIEERGADELLAIGGSAIAPAATAVRNPAFDVTPARLVTALISDRGVAAPPTVASVAALVR